MWERTRFSIRWPWSAKHNTGKTQTRDKTWHHLWSSSPTGQKNPLTSDFWLQWELIESAFTPRSNDSADVTGFYRLRSVLMKTWHPGESTNFFFIISAAKSVFRHDLRIKSEELGPDSIHSFPFTRAQRSCSRKERVHSAAEITQFYLQQHCFHVCVWCWEESSQFITHHKLSLRDIEHDSWGKIKQKGQENPHIPA